MAVAGSVPTTAFLYLCTMKKCGKCNTLKPFDEFHKCKSHKDGLASRCKPCKKLDDQKYNEQNKERIALKKKEYNERNKERLAEAKKLYSKKHSERLKEYKKQYYEKNKEVIVLQKKEYYEKTKDVAIARSRKHYLDNKELIAAKKREYEKRRRESDPMFKTMCNLRSRLYKSCRALSINKQFKTIDSLGITPEEFKLYIESLFTDGMSWDNYGLGHDKWSLDHIKPLCMATTEDELFALNHYTNLQPMWWFDNLMKAGKYQEQ